LGNATPFSQTRIFYRAGTSTSEEEGEIKVSNTCDQPFIEWTRNTYNYHVREVRARMQSGCGSCEIWVLVRHGNYNGGTDTNFQWQINGGTDSAFVVVNATGTPGTGTNQKSINSTTGYFYNNSDNIAILGNMSIGTAAPAIASKLFIEGNSIVLNTEGSNQAKSIYFRFSDGGDLRSDTFLTFSTGGSPSEKMRLTATGNLGIGSTNPASRLYVVGSATQNTREILAQFRNSGDFGRIDIRDENGDTSQPPGLYSPTAGFGLGLYAALGPIIFYAGGITSADERFRILTTGEVGINTTTPQRRLDVFGSSVNATAVSFNTNVAVGQWTGISFGYGETANFNYRKAALVFERTGGAAEGKIHILNNNSADISSASLADARLTILPDGKVGVGATSPIAKFTVLGTGSYNVLNETLASDTVIWSSEMTNDAYNSILQLVSVRQSLTTGSASNGFLGFSTVDDSNAQGIRDAGRIAIVNESPSARNSATALGFWTNAGGTNTTAATEKVRITSSGNVSIGNTNNTYKLDVEGTGRFSGNVLVNNVATSGYAFTSVAGSWASGSQIYTAIKIGAASDNLVGTGVDLRAYSNYASNAGTEFRLFVNNSSNVLTEALRIDSSRVVTLSNLAGTGSRIVVADASGTLSASSALSGYVTGSGTTNYVPKWTSGSAIGNSQIFDNGSNVGIFTTTQAWTSLRQSIQVGNSVVLSAGTNYYPYASFLGNNVYYDTSDVARYINASGASMFYFNAHSGGNFFWSVADPGTAGATIAFRTPMALNNSGQLSIVGTSATANNLTVVGNIRAGGSGTAGGQVIASGGLGNGNFVALRHDDNNAFITVTRTVFDGNLVLQPHAAVIVNNTAQFSNEKFQVYGAVSANGLAIIRNDANQADVNHGGLMIMNRSAYAIGNDASIGFALEYDGYPHPRASIGAKTASEYGADLVFNTRSSAGSFSEKMRISATGLLGIGTTAPNRTLHVTGTTRHERVYGYGNNALSIPNSVSFGTVWIHLGTCGAFTTDKIYYRVATNTSEEEGEITVSNTCSLPFVQWQRNTYNAMVAQVKARMTGGCGQCQVWIQVRYGSDFGGSNTNLNWQAYNGTDSGFSVVNAVGTPGTGTNEKNIVGSEGYFYANSGSITVADNIGIGLTAPSAKLHIDSALGNDAIRISDAAGSVRFAIGQEASYTGNYINSRNIDFKIQAYQAGGSGGNIIFQTQNNGTASVSERMRILPSGRIGVNSSNPQTFFEINRDFAAGSTQVDYLRLTSSQPGAWFSRMGLQFRWNDFGNGVSWNLGSIEGEVDGWTNPNGGGALLFLTKTFGAYSTDPTEKMRLTAAGNLGLGNTNPGSRLVVTGTGTANTRATIAQFNNSDNSLRVYLTDEHSDSRAPGLNSDAGYGLGLYATSAAPIIFYTGGSTLAYERMRITGAGDALIGYTTDQGAYLLQVNGSVYASAYFESSDTRLKNIINKHEGLDFGAIEYTWKDGRDNKLHWGYAAQEVMKYMPDAVNENKDGFLSLDYNQAHTYKIAMLENRIAELEKQLKNK
jgi:hypothetical protein